MRSNEVKHIQEYQCNEYIDDKDNHTEPSFVSCYLAQGLPDLVRANLLDEDTHLGIATLNLKWQALAQHA